MEYVHADLAVTATQELITYIQDSYYIEPSNLEGLHATVTLLETLADAYVEQAAEHNSADEQPEETVLEEEARTDTETSSELTLEEQMKAIMQETDE